MKQKDLLLLLITLCNGEERNKVANWKTATLQRIINLFNVASSIFENDICIKESIQCCMMYSPIHILAFSVIRDHPPLPTIILYHSLNQDPEDNGFRQVPLLHKHDSDHYLAFFHVTNSPFYDSRHYPFAYLLHCIT